MSNFDEDELAVRTFNCSRMALPRFSRLGFVDFTEDIKSHNPC